MSVLSVCYARVLSLCALFVLGGWFVSVPRIAGVSHVWHGVCAVCVRSVRVLCGLGVWCVCVCVCSVRFFV